MCGIAGIWSKDGVLPMDLLAHRGPDAFDSFRDGDLTLCHWRLSIIDLSERANQPMPNEDESLWLVFNGEIYNYRELRSELLAKGHTFRSASDSEVLLHLYEDHGPPMLEKLRGMFAFAIYDRTKKELFIARDPFGIKPLVYAELPSGFVFASELRAIAGLREFPREMDSEALSLYFRLNYIPAPWTIWKHARKLRPGSYLIVRSGKIVTEKSYFSIDCRERGISTDEALNGLDAVLQDSISHHLVSDVPVGAFLSGGIDSSLIVAIAQRFLDRPMKTFTVTFPEVRQYDESAYARTAARYIGTDHTELPVTVTEAREVMEEIIRHIDEPFADSSLVPTALISKVTGRHVKVALTGDGGDEFFGGYSKYQGMVMASKLRAAGPLLRALAALPLPETRGTAVGDKVRQLRKLARVITSDEVEMLVRSMEVFGESELEKVFTSYRRGRTVEEEVGSLLREAESSGCRDFNKVLYCDSRFVLPYDMLQKIDSASMRYSLEVRVPFVDSEVARFAFMLPGAMKLRGLTRKWVLRKVAERYLPREIIRRPKVGFGIPLGEWLRGELSGHFREVLGRENILRTGCLNPDFVESLFHEHMSRRKDRFWELWSFYVFVRWWQNNRDGSHFLCSSQEIQ